MPSTEDHAAFVDFFAQGWRLPKAQPFIDHFWPRVHPEVYATQPLFPPARGKAAFEKAFRRTFAILPDLTATVVRWAGTGDTVYIESRCAATIGRKNAQFPVCDAFVLRDGLIIERHSYFDSSPIFWAVVMRPGLWLRASRALGP